MTVIEERPVKTVPIEMLTDEELSLLAPDPSVVVTPYLSDLAEDEREVVRRTALRGLLARGIVDPPTGEPDGGSDGAGGDVEVETQIRSDVQSALTLRRAARTVVAIARTTATGQDFWYAHLVNEVVLVEQVGLDGIHRFALARGEDLGDLLVAAALAPDSVDGEGEQVDLDAVPDGEPPAVLLERLGEAYLRADLVVVTADVPGGGPESRPTLTGLFTGPVGSWSVVSDPAARTVLARPERIDAVEKRLHALARGAVDTAAKQAAAAAEGRPS
jgi:hypothetical protein